MTSVEALRTLDQDLRPLLMEGDTDAISRAVAEWTEARFAVRVLRGTRMQTAQDVFTEFAAALQFPHYFGHNKDAFDECIADLSWLPPGPGYVLLITEPDQVLANEPRTSLHWLVASLKSARAELARPLDSGEWWYRPSAPFHVVLAGDGSAS